jgi:hypothetical protein
MHQNVDVQEHIDNTGEAHTKKTEEISQRKTIEKGRRSDVNVGRTISLAAVLPCFDEHYSLDLVSGHANPNLPG